MDEYTFRREMEIKEFQDLYSGSPQVKALGKAIERETTRRIVLEGLSASAPSVVFSALRTARVMVFVMQDGDDAGYLYHDLVQQRGETDVLFFPSSYKRAIRYG